MTIWRHHPQTNNPYLYSPIRTHRTDGWNTLKITGHITSWTDRDIYKTFTVQMCQMWADEHIHLKSCIYRHNALLIFMTANGLSCVIDDMIWYNLDSCNGKYNWNDAQRDQLVILIGRTVQNNSNAIKFPTCELFQFETLIRLHIAYPKTNWHKFEYYDFNSNQCYDFYQTNPYDPQMLTFIMIIWGFGIITITVIYAPNNSKNITTFKLVRT